MNNNTTLLNTLTESDIYRAYERACSDTTELPVALRATTASPTPSLRDIHPHSERFRCGKRESNFLEVTRRLLGLLGTVLTSGAALAVEIFNEPFTDTATPTGWELRGSASLPGGYFQPTPDCNFHSWGNAFYTDTTFNSANFVFSAEINVSDCGSSMADGITFTWVDSSQVSDKSRLAGFSGGSLGMPDVGPNGYAFTLRSRPGTPPQTGLFRTDRALAFEAAVREFTSEDTYQNVGWLPVRLTCQNGAFTFNWGAAVGGSGYAHSFTFTIPAGPGYEEFQAYENAWFGITGATGDSVEKHWIRNARLEASADQPPVANAGTDFSVNEGQTGVVLDGSQSLDPDGDPLSYTWTQTDGPPVSLVGPNTAMPVFTAPTVGVGGADLTFQLKVDDGFGGQAVDTVVIHVQNITDPPNVSAARPTTSVLWPPNHQMVAVGITGVSAPGSDVTIVITGVTQDEPTNGCGDGDTAIDAILDDDVVLLRAERAGNGNGRVYRVSFTASNAGGSDSGVVYVKVPHSKKKPAIDSGGVYDSTVPTVEGPPKKG